MPTQAQDLQARRANRPDRCAWPLTVVDATELAGGGRRVRLVSEIDGFSYAWGEPLVLKLPTPNGEAALRHFRVCGFDAVEERLEVDFDLRGERRALEWLRTAAFGDQLIAETPRARRAIVGSRLVA